MNFGFKRIQWNHICTRLSYYRHWTFGYTNPHYFILLSGLFLYFIPDRRFIGIWFERLKVQYLIGVFYFTCSSIGARVCGLWDRNKVALWRGSRHRRGQFLRRGNWIFPAVLLPSSGSGGIRYVLQLVRLLQLATSLIGNMLLSLFYLDDGWNLSSIKLLFSSIM